MKPIERRKFLQLAGAGAGAVVLSSLFYDQLFAGMILKPGEELFASRFGVSKQVMKKVLDAALSKGGDFAELFFEYALNNNVVMEDDIIRESSEDITLGVGIRVLNGKQTGYAYTSDLSPETMQRAALTAAAIASTGAKVRVAAIKPVQPGRQVYLMTSPFADAPLGDRITLVKEAYAAAKGHDPRISKVVANLGDSLQCVTIVNSEGLMVSDARPQVRLRASATAEEKGRRVTGSSNKGGRVGMTFYRTPGTTPKEIGEAAGKEAVILLSATDPAPGEMPVVLGRFHSGVMVHEAVGHPLEADGNWQKTSIMWDKLGQMVADPSVTIYDDATIPHYRGSLNVDDEGTPSQKVMLIDKGRLVSYLHDRLSARILKTAPNGHGRRQSFSNLPIPRMNNTVLAPGSASAEDIIKSVKKGFYADSYAGGMVENTGKFTFSVNLGYAIEDGRLTQPVKNATLIGTNVQILKEVEMIGNDLAFFLGTCGKDDQSAAVTAGTPTFKIRQMTVGGRS
jgi:TldD protein